MYGFAAIHGPRSLGGPRAFGPGRRPHCLQVGNAIPGHCRLPGLRPAAAPPGGRARARSGARRSFRRITASLPRWIVGLLGVAGALEPALLAERSKDCEAKGSIE
jgi:hypothetical protein